jgi:hypothetical protein
MFPNSQNAGIYGLAKTKNIPGISQYWAVKPESFSLLFPVFSGCIIALRRKI